MADRHTWPVMTALIFVITAIGFGLQYLIDPTFSTVSLIAEGGNYHMLANGGIQWSQLIVPIFLHVGIAHFGSNMLALWMLGPFLETEYGHLKYLLIYLITGMAGNFLSAILNPNIVAVGASTSLFGLMGLVFGAMLSHKNESMRLYGHQLTGFLLINIFATFTVPNIDIGGHLGGFLSGLVLGLLVPVASAWRNE